jgi:hypothetical protein
MFSIFVITSVTIRYIFTKEYEYAILNAGIACFLVYLKVWSYLKAKSEK